MPVFIAGRTKCSICGELVARHDLVGVPYGPFATPINNPLAGTICHRNCLRAWPGVDEIREKWATVHAWAVRGVSSTKNHLVFTKNGEFQHLYVPRFLAVQGPASLRQDYVDILGQPGDTVRPRTLDLDGFVLEVRTTAEGTQLTGAANSANGPAFRTVFPAAEWRSFQATLPRVPD